MKTAIICISDPYLVRGKQLKDFYTNVCHDEVIILTPDFSHRNKAYIEIDDSQIKLIHHPSYKKNLSVRRMVGHWLFARRCRLFLENYSPDRIHCLMPANSLGPEMAAYKKKNPETQLIFDVLDLWPESFPISMGRYIPGFGLWKKLRQSALEKADQVYTECEFYKQFLPDSVADKAQTLYWAGIDQEPKLEQNWDSSSIDIAYLGSINHILDLDLMVSLMTCIARDKKVVFHLIGAGEKKEELCSRLRLINNLDLIDHGEVYDSTRKQEIFNRCRFGLNLMKSHIIVALSMKSIDYFQSGLPVINNLSGDTWDFIEMYNAGYNLDADHIEIVARKIIEQSELDNQRMRRAARKLFLHSFSIHAFEEVLKLETVNTNQNQWMTEPVRKG
ncbi:hypothetical protein AAK979_00675 [Ileibacterium valens]|uniref:hypothetical protein n=1 Tax=Ileibacterium valens TaxID=1862668 RepID=UPI003511670B